MPAAWRHRDDAAPTRVRPDPGTVTTTPPP